jgi:hypothetical protein
VADLDAGQTDEAGTCAERLLYALGQLYRMHHAGVLDISPADMNILHRARIIGQQEHRNGLRRAARRRLPLPRGGSRGHPAQAVSLGLMSLDEWVRWSELEDFERRTWFD